MIYNDDEIWYRETRAYNPQMSSMRETCRSLAFLPRGRINRLAECPPALQDTHIPAVIGLSIAISSIGLCLSSFVTIYLSPSFQASRVVVEIGLEVFIDVGEGYLCFPKITTVGIISVLWLEGLFVLVVTVCLQCHFCVVDCNYVVVSCYYDINIGFFFHFVVFKMRLDVAVICRLWLL